MKKFIIFIIFGLVTAWACSPYYALYEIKQHYDNHEHQALANTIDYPQLTKNLKTQLSTSLDNTVSSYPIVEKIAGDTFKTMGKNMINSSVDGAVTPENVQNLLKKNRQINQATKELGAIWAIATDKIDLVSLVKDTLLTGGNIKTVAQAQITTKIAEQEALKNKQNTSNTDDTQLSYCALDCFQVSTKVQSFPITVELQRQGFFGWKVVDVKLP